MHLGKTKLPKFQNVSGCKSVVVWQVQRSTGMCTAHLVTVCLCYVVDYGLLGDGLIMWSTWSPCVVDCGLIQTEEEEVIEAPRTN